MRIAIIFGLVLGLAACTPPNASEAPEPTTVAEVAVELATVSTPASGASVTSPLHVSGVAPSNWYFENQFPVRLLDASGTEIAMAPAHPRVNWTDPGPKEFDAELTFTATGPATLVLEEDMPGEGNEPRQLRIPVILQ
jgi:hypothetical protein